jgi:hypothetical protein
MSRNFKIAILLFGLIAGVLVLSSWGRTVLLGVVGIALLPVWAILLASVFFIACIVIGAVILAVTESLEKRTEPATNLVDEPMSPTAERVVVVDELDEEEHPRAA